MPRASRFARAGLSALIALPLLTAPAFPQATRSADRDRFRWPLRGEILEPYGPRQNGIDIKTPVGEPVHAAANGECIFAGDLPPFGKLILIRHPHGYVTAYGYNSELLIKQNDKVKRGQIIAKSGEGGTPPSPRLHFELRKDSQPVDPTKFLVPL